MGCRDAEPQIGMPAARSMLSSSVARTGGLTRLKLGGRSQVAAPWSFRPSDPVSWVYCVYTVNAICLVYTHKTDVIQSHPLQPQASAPRSCKIPLYVLTYIQLHHHRETCRSKPLEPITHPVCCFFRLNAVNKRTGKNTCEAKSKKQNRTR